MGVGQGGGGAKQNLLLMQFFALFSGNLRGGVPNRVCTFRGWFCRHFAVFLAKLKHFYPSYGHFKVKMDIFGLLKAFFGVKIWLKIAVFDSDPP